MIYDFKGAGIVIVWNDGKQKVKSKNSQLHFLNFDF